MNGNGAPPHLRNGSSASNGGRMSGDQRHMSTGSLNMPNGPQNGAARFEGPRSPPGKQNTSHVPCKFFKQGQCQAGQACPFSHDLSNTAETICKYFNKGNCKFGHKCANQHILPDGRKVLYSKGGVLNYVTFPAVNMNLGGRIPPDQYTNQSSALTNGFMAHNGMASFGPYQPMRHQEEGFPGQFDMNPVAQIDTSYASPAYGSPREEMDIRSNLGLSPGNKVFNIKTAPLPPGWDSNGVSTLYRNGPQAASVPAQFGIGLGSPPQSFIPSLQSETLENLQKSAFGDDTTRDRFNNAISSSPNPGVPEIFFGKKPMHSQQRFARPKLMSASVPKGIDSDWDINDVNVFEDEEFIFPNHLTEDILTPQEKFRRGSRNADDESRPIYSGAGTPGDITSKFSPSNASPSRWNATFLQKQQRDEEEKLSRSSAFGHVGSPLRPSSFQAAIGSSAGSRPRSISRPDNVSGDAPPSVASPRSNLSLIAQGIQRVRLGAATNENGQHVVGSPGSLSTRITSNPSHTRRDLGAAGERAISSSSIGTGRFSTTPIIDEEQPGCVFNMDEDEAASTKRHSGGLGYPVGGRSPHSGTLGARTPSSALASNGNSGTNGNGNSSSLTKLFARA